MRRAFRLTRRPTQLSNPATPLRLETFRLSQSKRLNIYLSAAFLASSTTSVCLFSWHLNLSPSLSKLFDVAQGGTVIGPPDVRVTTAAVTLVCLITGITLN